MAIVRSLGKPDLFVTFICNPDWPEIRDSLFANEKPSDRPDITTRVFNIKLNALIEDLTVKHILGKVKGYCAMKEDQKRGLPHYHILLILAEQCKSREPQDVDTIVSAEIPDKTINPRLYDIITRNNIRGPCGYVSRNNVCTTTGACEKGFSKKKH